MVYGRLMFNNIKEYTPSFIKTIPYNQIAKPVFGKQKQVQSKLMADPKIKRLLKFIQKNVQKNPFTWQIFIFASKTIIILFIQQLPLPSLVSATTLGDGFTPIITQKEVTNLPLPKKKLGNSKMQKNDYNFNQSIIIYLYFPLFYYSKTHLINCFITIWI